MGAGVLEEREAMKFNGCTVRVNRMRFEFPMHEGM
jgi:hypothetical protein